MREKSGGSSWKWTGVVVLALGLASASVRAGVSSAFYIGNVAPVQDEYGRPMRGSHRMLDAALRPLVEVRTSTDGIIRPPSITGEPHPYNPLLTPDSAGGMGMNTASSDSGLFCLVLGSRPSPGTKLFARAYNAPTREASSFYADTAMVVVPTPTNGVSVKVVFSAAKPLDTGDVDGDGLNNSWEKTLGTDDRPSADYDGDGMLDLHEMLAGTSPTDPGSLLEFRAIREEESTEPTGADGEEPEKRVRMRWQSVPGRRYQLQYSPSLLGEMVFIPVGDVVTAAEGETEMDVVVDVPEETTDGFFRVRLVRD